MKYREVLFYKDYFLSFYRKQSDKIKRKIDSIIEMVEAERIIPAKFFKQIRGSKGLYEIRIEFSGDIFRVFSFFDKDKLIILINGFQKKKQKTPRNEIIKALKIKKEYVNEKSTS